jgi:hypothetical protein
MRDDTYPKAHDLIRWGTCPGFYGDNDPYNCIGDISIDRLVTDGTGQLRSGLSPLHKEPCPICRLSNPTKVYFSNDQFIIVTCPKCRLPLIVICPHSMNYSKEIEDKIIREVNNIFGSSALIERQSEYPEHINWHVLRNPTPDYQLFYETHIIPRAPKSETIILEDNVIPSDMAITSGHDDEVR